MNRQSVYLFLMAMGALIPVVAAAEGVGLPDAAELARSENAFELRPGVVVEPNGGVVYLMTPEGGVEKVAVASGDVVWSTTEAAKPLALYGDLLIARAESADDDGTLEIVLLEARGGGARRADLTITLPAGVGGGVDEGMDRALVTRAVVSGGEPMVTWEYTKRYAKGVEPEANEPLEQKQNAAYLVDLSTRQAVALDGVKIAPEKPLLPASVNAWQASGAASIPVVQAGSVLAATQAQHDSGSQWIMLKRWDAVSGVALSDIELFSRQHILQFASVDGRHLLVAERANPGQFAEYQWHIFSLETGKRLGQVSHHRSHAWFFISENTTENIMVYVESPYGHRVGETWIDEPRKAKAIHLDSAFPVWERPLRDTTYAGPFAP